MTEIEPKAEEAKTQTAHCSFCGKSQHKVSFIIAAPHGFICNAFICNECVDMCNDILAEKNISSDTLGANAAAPNMQNLAILKRAITVLREFTNPSLHEIDDPCLAEVVRLRNVADQVLGRLK